MHQATRMQGMRAVHEDDWIILLAQNTARGLRVEQILTLVAALELFKAWTQSPIDDWSAPDAPCTIHAWRGDNGCTVRVSRVGEAFVMVALFTQAGFGNAKLPPKRRAGT